MCLYDDYCAQFAPMPKATWSIHLCTRHYTYLLSMVAREGLAELGTMPIISAARPITYVR